MHGASMIETRTNRHNGPHARYLMFVPASATTSICGNQANQVERANAASHRGVGVDALSNLETDGHRPIDAIEIRKSENRPVDGIAGQTGRPVGFEYHCGHGARERQELSKDYQERVSKWQTDLSSNGQRPRWIRGEANVFSKQRRPES